jgi:hypothetical protein
MNQPKIHLGPIPSPIEMVAGQVIFSASIYPDKRSSSTGGYILAMQVDTAAKDSVKMKMLDSETHATVELARAKAMAVAATHSPSEVYLQLP